MFSSKTGQDGTIDGWFLTEKRLYLFCTASKYSLLSAVCLAVIFWGKTDGESRFYSPPSSAEDKIVALQSREEPKDCITIPSLHWPAFKHPTFLFFSSCESAEEWWITDSPQFLQCTSHCMRVLASCKMYETPQIVMWASSWHSGSIVK